MNDGKTNRASVWNDGQLWNQPPESLKLPVDGSNFMAVTEVTTRPRTSVQVADESGRASNRKKRAVANNPDASMMYPNGLQQQYGHQPIFNVQYSYQAVPINPIAPNQTYWHSPQSQHGYQQFYYGQVCHSQNTQYHSFNPDGCRMYSSNAHPQHGYHQFDRAHNTDFRGKKAFPNNPDFSQMSLSNSQQQCDSQKFDKYHYERSLFLKNLEIGALEMQFKLVNNECQTLKKENESLKKLVEKQQECYMEKANRVTELEEVAEAWERDFAELEDRHVALAKTTFGDPFAFKNKATQTKDQSTSTESENEEIANKAFKELALGD